MLKSLLNRKDKELSLIAHSGVQFLDYGFNAEAQTSPIQGYFLERERSGTDGAEVELVSLRRSADRESWVEASSGAAVSSTSIYRVTLEQALSAFNRVWLPVPFLKFRGRDAVTGVDAFEPGPSNWTRLHIAALDRPDANGNTHRLTFAFDTRIEDRAANGPYLAPCPDDVRNETRFKLANELRDNSWMLRSEWIKGWLSDAFTQSVQAKRAVIPRRHDERHAECAFWAFYIVLLQGITRLVNAEQGPAPLPTMRFLDVITGSTYQTNEVDLVLDIGNSRTCGVLVEVAAQAGLRLTASAVLELRDLSRPELAYEEPFRSHCEFAKPDFGNDFWSRASGRPQAFKWPSLVRVGPEALRLNGRSSGAEGDTGLSGPKRYLWDERPNAQQWYFNVAESRDGVQTPVFGEIMEHVTAEGDLIEFTKSGRPALQPKFSRASLFTMMVMELMLHAVSQINSPAMRLQLGSPNVPRRLRNIVFTIPTATPAVERKCFERRCLAAVKLVWRTLGWSADISGTPPEPKVIIAYDEATCTQILYLYNEIAERFRKSASDFFSLAGRATADGGSSLRIASIDIGGGTTDLVVITYQIDKNSDTTLNPKQNFREGFRKAGDDILEAIVVRDVLPALEKALTDAGVRDAHSLILDINSSAGADASQRQRGQMDAMQRHRRQLLVSQVLVPIALTMMAQYENRDQLAEPVARVDVAEVLTVAARPDAKVIAYIDELAARNGATEFSLAHAVLTQPFARIEATVTSVMRDILSVMCEVIHQFDCDLLLVTGRPSRLPIMRDLIVSNMPVSAHRITFMHNYRVERWYPFASRFGTIEDPKTTVVVGALLCTLAEGVKLEGFGLRKNALTLDATTANFVGRMDRSDAIKKENVVFGPRNAKSGSEVGRLQIEGPSFVGFRQLSIERWPGTPLFFIEIAAGDYPTPWIVSVRREAPDGGVDGRTMPVDEGFEIESIVDRDGNDVPRSRLSMRMQTLREADGYWLDTGVLNMGLSMRGGVA